MKRAANLSAFVARPVPYFFSGECFVVWAYSDDLVGTIAWGAGAVGAMVAGFNVVIEQNKTWFLAHELAEAVARLGRRDAADVIAALDALATRMLDEPALIAQLRTALEENPALEASDAAKQVGMSLRTMQRTLGELETSFLEVRDRLRVALAQRLMAESGHKAEVIARRIGLGSREGLWRLLRRHGIELNPDDGAT